MTTDQATAPPVSRDQRFVEAILQRCLSDKGVAARLRRADNPSLEYQSWETLGALGIDLEQEHQRLPHVTVAAAIAKSKAESNGVMRLGAGIAACYGTGNGDAAHDQARARLRRLLACEDLREACRILRPILTLIDSKVGRPLDFIRLLRQLRQFGLYPQSVKAEWAQEFYARPAKAAAKGDGA
jgi:CRISPR system Cascade subunit CasB